MIPEPAQYLLRFDDLCPTVERNRWEQYRRLINRFGILPILAIVPDNRDPDLNLSPPDSDFWEEMRHLQAAGATTAVHGYQHLCCSQGKSLLGLHSETEFAGVSLDTQRDWIRRGFRTLEEKGLHPRLWIGPRHGFDKNSLRALRSLGVEYISDGFARLPYRQHGITWIPQQLWGPVAKSKGLWTICIHPNSAGPSDIKRLERFLEDHAGEVTSFDRVVADFPAQALSLWERMYERIARARVQARYYRHRRRLQTPGQAGAWTGR